MCNNLLIAGLFGFGVISTVCLLVLTRYRKLLREVSRENRELNHDNAKLKRDQRIAKDTQYHLAMRLKECQEQKRP